MRRLSLLVVLFLGSITTYGQIDSTEYEVDTLEQRTRIEVDFGRADFDSTTNLTTRWFTFGLGINPVHVDGDFNFSGTTDLYDDFDDLRLVNSTNVEIGIVNQKLNLIDHKFHLVWGLGIDNNKYSFEDDFFIDPDSDTWESSDDLIAGGTKKNRLSVKYLQVPLMLNFESTTRHYNSFRLSAGGYGGVRIGSNQKIKFKQREDNLLDGDKLYKEKDNFNLNNFVYGIKGELGYGPVNLYAKYQLNELFKDTINDDLQTMSVGIMIVPF